MRKVALVSEHASPLALTGGVDSGGQNIYVANVAKQLAQSGYTVDIFTRRDNLLQPAIVKWKHNIRVIHVAAGPAKFIPKEQMLPYMEEFGTYLHTFFSSQKRPYDVIHANFFMSGFAALSVAQTFNIPLVMTFHALGRVRRLFQHEADCFPDTRFDIEDQLIQDADRIIAECPQDKLDMVSLYNAQTKKIDIVPCGFDPAELNPVNRQKARELLGWNEHEFIILQLGRMVPRKGVDNVIRALALLRNSYNINARLYVVGGNADDPNEIATPEIGRLRKIAEMEDVASQVNFIGRRGREMLRYFYSAANVFVTTPWYEPFGITPVEAMACGTPVIGSAVGGIKSTVVEGETGYLLPPNATIPLANRLAYLYQNPELAVELGRAGCERANRLFTWRQVGHHIAQVYERTITHDQVLPAVAETRIAV